MKSSNPVEVISTLPYGQVTDDPVRLALFVTLATQPSEVFYRALVPFRPSVIRIVWSIIFLFVQRNATHFARVKEEGHPKNLMSQWWRTRTSFFVPWRLRRQKKKKKPGKELLTEVIPSQELYSPSIACFISFCANLQNHICSQVPTIYPRRS